MWLFQSHVILAVCPHRYYVQYQRYLSANALEGTYIRVPSNAF